jgi:hypothetical protein
MRKFLAACAVLVALGTIPLRATAGSGAARSCAGDAWPLISDVTHGNAYFPDTNATYWLTPYTLANGESLVVRGLLPKARYSSLTTYTAWGTPIEHVIDDDVAARPGDPFTAAVSTTVAPGQHQPATIAAGTTAGPATGYLALRVYLADDPGDPRGSEPLPDLGRRAADGTETALPLCPDPTGASPSAGLRIPTAGSNPVTFVRYDSSALFANLDNAYIAASIRPLPGRVVLMRGKAPTFPDTRNGRPITGHEQLRYWSVCTNALRYPLPVTDCAADYTLPLDAEGDYHLVVSRTADKPANLAPGTVWLRWDDTASLSLILRNMLPSPGFAHAAQDVPRGSSDLTAMGPYAPHAELCTRAAYEKDTCPQP